MGAAVAYCKSVLSQVPTETLLDECSVIRHMRSLAGSRSLAGTHWLALAPSLVVTTPRFSTNATPSTLPTAVQPSPSSQHHGSPLPALSQLCFLFQEREDQLEQTAAMTTAQVPVVCKAAFD